MNVFLTALGCRLNEAEVESWARSFRAAGHAVVASPEQRAGHGGQHLRGHRRGGAQVAQAGRRPAPAQPERAPGGDRLLRRAGAGGRRPSSTASTWWSATATRTGWSRGSRPSWTSPAMPVAGRRSGRRPRVPRGAHPRVRQGAGRLPQPVQLLRGHHRARRGAQPHRRGGRSPRCARLEEAGSRRGGAVRRPPGRLRLATSGSTSTTWSTGSCAPPSVPRVRLSSLEPWDLPDDFGELWRESEGRLLPHLHLPLQSGSDPVLRRMARRCMTASFSRLVDRAARRDPGPAPHDRSHRRVPRRDRGRVSRHPGVRRARIGFAHVHVFPVLSARGHARRRAARPGAARCHPRARARAGRAGRAHEGRPPGRAVGQTRPVLWETGERGARGDGSLRFSGYTDTYLRVEIEMPAAIDLENAIEPVAAGRRGRLAARPAHWHAHGYTRMSRLGPTLLTQ